MTELTEEDLKAIMDYLIDSGSMIVGMHDRLTGKRDDVFWDFNHQHVDYEGHYQRLTKERHRIYNMVSHKRWPTPEDAQKYLDERKEWASHTSTTGTESTQPPTTHPETTSETSEAASSTS